MRNFDREIEARWPDPDGTPGWDEIRLVCGHTEYLPSDVKNRLSHCGQCRLDHEAHQRQVAAINRKLEAEQRVRAAALDQMLDETYGPEENPF
jgi:hypothetical protein